MHLFCYFVVTIGLASAQLPTDKICASCMHISFNLHNIPKASKDMLDSVFSSLSNPSCMTSNANTITCSGNSPFMVNKCQVTTVNMKAEGMKIGIPEAVMDMTMVIKNCVPQQVGTPDKCINFQDMDVNTRDQLTAQLQSIRDDWNNVDFSGKSCIGDNPAPPVGNPTDTASSTAISLICLVSALVINLL